MTRMTNARLAGSAYLFYMAVGISNEVLTSRALSAEGTAAKLTRIATYATDVRMTIIDRFLATAQQLEHVALDLEAMPALIEFVKREVTDWPNHGPDEGFDEGWDAAKASCISAIETWAESIERKGGA